ncbi:guanine nucleotide-binding protein-like 3 isoform X1 [Monodelphis domestica]|uniref:Guanine nucleotide-binding protein-like 3 n=1 Tax=Monodelphis domestica TaxID=13616 RepID=F6R1B3_MONDO|nr:guanine nucleotide-binding protein-like 3 isoform X1 [Monodelphis domestica]
MKRPKLKKASKRMTCHKRFKIQKKVREHYRKVRKEAKKRGHKRAKKDPGVPNSAPFKEALLREAEQRKQQLEELKQKQKLNKQKEQGQKRKRDENSVVASKTEPAKTEFVRRKAKLSCKTIKQGSKKSFCRELQKVIETSDVLLEVLDARDPLGCRCPQVEQVITQTGGNKKLLLVLNKTDLVPKENLEKWVHCLKKELPTVVFRASTFGKEKIKMPGKKKLDLSRQGICLGGASLLTLLSGFCETQNKAIRVGVIGFPNVGKSSIINSLKQAYVCHTGPAMGLTRYMQIVHIDKKITILDSPSIIASPCNSALALALRSPTNIEERETLDSVTTILEYCNKQQLMLRYNIPSYRDSQEFLTLLAQKKGMVRKGGIPKVEEAAKLFWSHWTGPKMSYYCQIPSSLTLSSHLTESIVADMQQGLNLEELEKNNVGAIRAIRGPRLSSSILFQSSGLTNGIIEEKDVPEELPGQESEEEEEDEDSDDENDLEERSRLGNKRLKVEKITLEEFQSGEEFDTREEKSSHKDKVIEEDDDTYSFNTDYV